MAGAASRPPLSSSPAQSGRGDQSPDPVVQRALIHDEALKRRFGHQVVQRNPAGPASGLRYLAVLADFGSLLRGEVVKELRAEVAVRLAQVVSGQLRAASRSEGRRELLEVVVDLPQLLDARVFGLRSEMHFVILAGAQ